MHVRCVAEASPMRQLTTGHAAANSWLQHTAVMDDILAARVARSHPAGIRGVSGVYPAGIRRASGGHQAGIRGVSGVYQRTSGGAAKMVHSALPV